MGDLALSPFRRVLLGIGGLVALLVIGLLVAWRLESRELGAQLMVDVEALMQRDVKRPSFATAPSENGFACISSVVRTPVDLGPVDQKNLKGFGELMDGGVADSATLEHLTKLAPWGDSLRRCGDATGLKFVEGVSPLTPGADERATRNALALLRLTQWEFRELVEREEWAAIADICARTLALETDISRVSLIGAMVTGAAVKKLAPTCALALHRMEPAPRALVSQRFEALPARLATNREWVETERVLVAIGMHGWQLEPEQQARLPVADAFLDDSIPAPGRFLVARTWKTWDRGMRQLVDVADAPDVDRVKVSAEVDELFSGPLVPGLLAGSPTYNKFFRRNDETRALLQLLADLAANREAFPAQVTRTPTGLEFRESSGGVLDLPL